MKRKKFRIMRAVCLIAMLVCLIRIGQIRVFSARHEAKQKELRTRIAYADEEQVSKSVAAMNDNDRADAKQPERARIDQVDGETGQTDNGGEQRGGKANPVSASFAGNGEQGEEPEEEEKTCNSGIPGEEGGRPILKKYKDLYMQNGDMTGWLSVEGTKIDYPVMQCEDDEYYLHHDFEKEDSKYGCLYVRERADLENGTNFVVYGHNMKDGSMFGELDLYLEEEFYKEHPNISFHTLYEEYTYEILAVFRSRIYGEKEDAFKYYQFYEAKTKEEFDDFYENVKELSLYDTGVEAEFGDTFLTLSTCAYHVKNGRLAVVAKRVG